MGTSSNKTTESNSTTKQSETTDNNQLSVNSQKEYLEIILNNIENRQYIIDSLFKKKTWIECYSNIAIILCFYFVLIIFFILRRISVLDLSSIGTIFLTLSFICFTLIGYAIKSAYDKIIEYETKDNTCKVENYSNFNKDIIEGHAIMIVITITIILTVIFSMICLNF